MVKINYRGRLGNNLIQYAAAALLAKKAGLSLESKPERTYSNKGSYKTSSSSSSQIITDFGKIFNLQSINGLCYEKTIELNDENYFDYLDDLQPSTGYILNGFFQDGRLLCDYREQILDLYKYKSENKPNNDAFFACRFGDCLTSHRAYCSIEYIEDQLKKFRDNYDVVYLTSDSLDYPPLVKLIENYNIIPYNDTPINKILFATQFNNLILSAGSFSYWMAYLGNAENIMVFKSKQDPLQKQNAWDYNKNVKFFKNAN